MVAATATDELTTDPGSDPGVPPVNPRLRRALLGILVALTVAGLAVTGWVLVSAGAGNPVDGAGTVFGSSDALSTDRAEAAGQARQFVMRLNTYGPEMAAPDGTMPDYRSSMTSVMSPKFGEEFLAQAAVLAEATVAAGVSRTTNVYQAGVAAIDADSATVLVAGDFTTSQVRKSGKSSTYPPQPYRFEVSMVKIGGTWLVDSYTPVGADEQARDEEAQQ